MANELQELNKADILDRFASYKRSVHNQISKANEAAGELQRKLVIAGTSALAGKYVADAAATNAETFSVFGLTFEQTMALGASAAEFLIEDRDTKRLVGGIADAFVSISCYQLGQEMQSRSAANAGTANP